MAFCPSCGEQLPNEAVFCPGCGSPVRSSAPAFVPPPAPSAGGGYAAPAPAPKKKKTGLIVGLIVGFLLIAGVLAALFFTGVLGGSASPVGTWTLTGSTDPSVSPGQIQLVLSEGGGGSATVHGSQLPLTWDKSAVFLGGARLPFSLSGDTLTLEDSGMRYEFSRSQLPADGGVTVDVPDLPAETPAPEFPIGSWSGEYVYNGNFFQVSIELNEDSSCSRWTYKNGELTRTDVGVFEYSDNEIRLYLNGETHTWTAYDVTGEMMVNNNHEYFRTHPGGVIGGWFSEYDYNGNHFKDYCILRTDMTASVLTVKNGEVIEDIEGTYTFDGETVLISYPGKDYHTPFSFVDGTLINGDHVYTHG